MHTHAGYPQTIALAYDANGHMTRDEAGRTLEYDATGRLSGGGYGSLNRLVSQSVSSADTRHLYYRGDERVSEVLVQQDRDIRLVKAGSSYLGVSDGSSLNLTGNDHHGGLLWSREASEAEGRQHSWSPYGTGEPVDFLPGFNCERADPVSGSYHLGNGYRVYTKLVNMRTVENLTINPGNRQSVLDFYENIRVFYVIYFLWEISGNIRKYQEVS